MPQADLGKEVTVFSDSIVISYPVDFGGSLFHIILDLIFILIDMICQGMVFRGGVVIGDVYHKDKIVFGPGMVEAYKFESEHAINPRVILTKETILKGVKHHPVQNTPQMELEYVMELLKQDKDGYFFIDYLSQAEELDEPLYDYPVLLNAAKKLFTKGCLIKTQE